MNVLGHLAYKIINAPVKTFPFPHIYVEEVFPDAYYWEMVNNLPPDGDYTTGASNYKGRRFADPAKVDYFDELRSPDWQHIAVFPFRHWINKRFPNVFEPRTDLRLVRDTKNYSIGPHTDAPWKVLSYLFYLPVNSILHPYGTSIYLPKDPNFRCIGGPHHKFEDFEQIYTAPFRPNSLFAFFKTDYSFHGVEPIPVQCQRDVLLWNLYDSDAQNGKATG